ncbi:unnamed protein product [Cylicocyclus nassatus]|uniref:Uncharacterized protein n=1 Tax=Cylicocyclus nassatus TaxID=53992 RepID=A0AA36MDC6_CYLNA|nr:unnamed protein product [Cylicocyclus nassatus]
MAEMNDLAKFNYLSFFEVKSSYYQWIGRPDLDQVYSLELHTSDNFNEMSFDNSYGCIKLHDNVYYICLGY